MSILRTKRVLFGAALGLILICVLFCITCFSITKSTIGADASTALEIVSTKAQLIAISENDEAALRKNYVLETDIDLSGTEWVPVGHESKVDLSEPLPFLGTFDGNGKTIKGLKITSHLVDTVGIGLFGLNYGEIKNLTVEVDDISVAALSDIGAIAGINEGTIENCKVIAKAGAGTVSGASNVGGAVGRNEGLIRYVDTFVTVSGTAHSIGGIAGFNKGEIYYCRNASSVATTGAAKYIGGIAGLNSGVKAHIGESENYGEIKGGGLGVYVGGVAGRVMSFAKVYASKNAGSVTGHEFAGGIAGGIDLYATAENCIVTYVAATQGIAYGAFATDFTKECGAFLAGSIEEGVLKNSYYLALENTELSDGAAGITARDMVSPKFLTRLDGGVSFGSRISDEEFLYYPEPARDFNKDKDFTKTDAFKRNKSGIKRYRLEGNDLVTGANGEQVEVKYGTKLSDVKLNAVSGGAVSWYNPQTVLQVGKNLLSVLFTANASSEYGDSLFEVDLNVGKATPQMSVHVSGFSKGNGEAKATVEFKTLEEAALEVVIEYKKYGAGDETYTETAPTLTGKYVVRASIKNSDKFTDTSVTSTFRITPNAHNVWLWIMFAVILVMNFLFIWYLRHHHHVAGVLKLAAEVDAFHAEHSERIERERLEEERQAAAEAAALAAQENVFKVVEKVVEVSRDPKETLRSLSSLSPRELAVAEKILEGKKRNDIATELFISDNTVKKHIGNILAKTNSADQKAFIAKCIDGSLTSND